MPCPVGTSALDSGPGFPEKSLGDGGSLGIYLSGSQHKSLVPGSDLLHVPRIFPQVSAEQAELELAFGGWYSEVVALSITAQKS